MYKIISKKIKLIEKYLEAEKECSKYLTKDTGIAKKGYRNSKSDIMLIKSYMVLLVKNFILGVSKKISKLKFKSIKKKMILKEMTEFSSKMTMNLRYRLDSTDYSIYSERSIVKLNRMYISTIDLIRK